MASVGKLLESKDREILSVTPDTLAFDALKLMSDKSIGVLCIMEGDKFIGMFSERDYARNTILKGKSSKQSPVSELMGKDLKTIKPEDSLQNCMDIMSSNHLRHLPVVDGDRLIGVISAGDVMKQMISENKNLIEALEKYISGGY